MIRINQLKLPVTHSEAAFKKKVGRVLKLREERILSIKIVKQSIDARKKEELLYIYSVDVKSNLEDEVVVENAKNPNVVVAPEKTYHFPKSGSTPLSHRPLIIGCGPAGLFCGLMLAKAGYRPLILERGEDVDARTERVNRFWNGGGLCGESNVQFGEGGAGTFSDGKLNTLLKDPVGRNQKVLELLVESGADPSILYVNKPHIGTDVLSQIVKNIREEIIRLGGEVRFNCKVTDLIIKQGEVTGVIAGGESMLADSVILAVGHSARDTFEMLSQKPLDMEAKAFAVGLRIQHPQPQINRSQYGIEEPGGLGAADYKLSRQTKSGRGVYSFCMCPGGFVVDASSEEGRLAVNGMSNHSRDGVSGNSAMIVTVTPEDFPDRTPMGGVHFQRKLEEAAYQCGGGKIPVQLYGDFKENKISQKFGEVEPEFKGLYAFGNLRDILPKEISEALIEGIDSLGGVLKGFNRADAVLAGVESRTSSPIRIPRDEHFESNVKGLYPCGEGAGYAGGITSAAMDGIKIAEVIAAKFAKEAGK